MIQWIIFELKATEGIRTPDLLITNQLLYQLSYIGTRTLQLYERVRKLSSYFFSDNCAKAFFSASGSGSPIFAAFSRTDKPSLTR